MSKLKDLLPWKCPNCGKLINALNKTCGFCGTSK